MFGVVIDEFLVNLIGQNINVLFSGDVDNCLQFFARINRAGGVARAVHDQHLGARGHRIFKVFRAHFPGVALAGRHDHRFGLN